MIEYLRLFAWDPEVSLMQPSVSYKSEREEQKYLPNLTWPKRQCFGALHPIPFGALQAPRIHVLQSSIQYIFESCSLGERGIDGG